MSIWFKLNKLSLNLTKTTSTVFHLQKKERLIANDLTISYIDNFEIIKESSEVYTLTKTWHGNTIQNIFVEKSLKP